MSARKGTSNRFRCDHCRRTFDIFEDGGDDCGGSHWFCYWCLEKLEYRASIIEARINRRHPKVTVDNTALFVLAYSA